MFEDNYTNENNIPEMNSTGSAQSQQESAAQSEGTQQGAAAGAANAESQQSAAASGATYESQQNTAASGAAYENRQGSTYGSYDYQNYRTQYQAVPPQTPPKKNHTGKIALAVALAAIIAIGAGVGAYSMGRNSVSASVTRTASAGTLKEADDVEEKEDAAEEAETKEDKEESKTEKKADKAIDQSSTVQLSKGESLAVVTDVTKVVEKAMPSIVSVYNNFTERVQFWGQIYTQENTAAGSGIIIGKTDDELLIVTNNHVVEGEDSLSVKFIDDTEADAHLKGTDSPNDLAVIAVSLDSLDEETLDAIAVAELGDSDTLKIGEPAIAIGNALGYGQSVTSGIISALDRQFQSKDGTDYTFIQTDAAINQGNSGGALLNINGQVIGINSNKLGGTAVEGMGYAIPISRAIPIMENLVNQQTKIAVDEAEQGTIGIKGVTVTSDVARAYDMPAGVYVAQIIEDGGAASSDLQEGDIIVGINGSTISEMEGLQKQLTYYKAGTEVTLQVKRATSGREYEDVDVKVTLGTKESLGIEQEEQEEQEQEEEVQEQPEEFPGEGQHGFQFHFGF